MGHAVGYAEVDLVCSLNRDGTLDTLGRLHIADPAVIEQLARIFADSRSVNVQRAVAEVFIRSDARDLPKAELAALVRRHRLASKGDDLIDALLRKLQS